MARAKTPITVDQIDVIRRLNRIGTALSSERNIDRLLEMIVDEARKFTRADGGTLYIIDDERRHLEFQIVQNESLKVRMGGTAGTITWNPVKLYNDDGSPNHANVSSHAALTGEVVNIPDVYHAKDFDFEGTRRFDSQTGYRSMSMLVIPMRDHENTVIGVLQLLNALDGEGNVIPFSIENQQLTESLASQAAVALVNNRLILELENLFNSFIETVAHAVDEKSPYTGSHGRRVVDITMRLAHAVNEAKEGPFATVTFSDDQLNELRISAWLHDVGKIAVPEYVMDKSTKLEAIFDRIELLRTRFELAKMCVKDRQHENMSDNCSNNNDMDKIGKTLHDDIQFLETANRGAEFMTDDKVARVKNIAAKVITLDNTKRPLLTEEEAENLCIRKGTLNEKERAVINSHAALTYHILSRVPFPRTLKNVPLYASSHHEYLNGSGYPNGLKGDEIPLQARILTIADIFEALTAPDRPYRKGNTISQAIKILGFMAKEKHLDADLLDLFVKEKVYLGYGDKELDPSQMDV